MKEVPSDENNDFNKKKKNISSHKHMYAGVQTFDTEPAVKPWKRVFSEVSRKGTHLYQPVRSVPCTLLIVLLGIYLLLGYLTQLIEDDVATVVREADLTNDNSDTFSEETAWRYINGILGDQPRVSGTPYHLQKTQDLKNLVDGVAAQGRIPVFTDWQLVTGDYWLEFTPPHVNYYQNLSNVVAVLEGQSGFNADGTTNSSILINCHYDSVPFALGVSDNTIFCGVMLEVLTKLSRRQERFPHNIVVLFNGAEENPLQGSHAFLQHPWARGVKKVINLDAAGMNGKATLFQVTDLRLLEIYRKATYKPSAQSFGEYLFSTGIVPSDTDFRIFRDFGGLQGIDIAFVKFGHVYHTRYDIPELVKTGVVQYAGNTLLQLATAAASDTADDQAEASTAVYFDYLNVLLVTYTFTVAHVLDTITLLFGVSSVLYYLWTVGCNWMSVQELLFAVLSRILGLAAGFSYSAILIAIMVATTVQMRYLAHVWIMVPVFWMPYILAAIAASQAFDAWRCKKYGFNRILRTVQAMAATRLVLILVLFAMLCIPSTVTVRYIVSVMLFILSCTSFISLTVTRLMKMEGWQHLLLEILLSLPSTMFVFSLALRLDALMLPIMARNSSDYPDYTVALLNVGFAALVLCSVSGMELLFSRKRLWMVISAAAVVCIAITFIPMQPYSDDGPSVQRHYWFHTEINTYNLNGQLTERTSGVLVTKYDPYSTSTVKEVIQERGLNVAYHSNFECDRYVYCNLPLFRTRFGRHLKDGLFLSAGAPAAFSPPAALQLNGRSCFGETCILNFTMIGAPHNLITLSPRPDVSLTSWTFNTTAQPSFYFLERPVYDVVHSVATYSDPLPVLNFSVTLLVPISLQSGAIIDVHHHSHKIHHPDDFTTEYRTLVESMPRYFNIASFLSFRNNYEF